ncbi:hypothetical protein ACROYT_G013789 [Oculina patagonica]
MTAKNLRSEAANDSAEDNLEEIRMLIGSLAEKIDKLDADSPRRHDAIYGKLEHLEERTNTLFVDVGEKKSLGSVNNEVEDFKQGLEDKADKSRVAKLLAKIDELENRSKRNVVFWNIPEGMPEDGSTCKEIIRDILVNHMNLEREIEITRAHRTTIKNSQNRRNGEQSSRPIHVALLRYPDKQFILRNAAAKLKDNPYLDAKIFISDDVSKAVRDEGKILKDRHLEEIRNQEGVEYAFIPWSVPLRILYKGTQYHQVFGCAMGSPVSAVIAELVMEEIEEKALASAPVKPRWWRRYVDDSNACLKSESIRVFHSHLNSINPHIQFTIEMPTTGTEGQTIAFLDTSNTVSASGQVEVGVYRKPTHTNISPSSHIVPRKANEL